MPSAAGVISDYVLTLKNGKVQQKASDLSINTSIQIAGTKIDGRTSVAVVEGSAKNTGLNADEAPPAVTCVTITPKSLNVGDELQLAFTTSRLLIFPPKVVIYDREVTVTKIDGTTYVASTAVKESDPKDVTFKIDNLVAENGKTAPPVTDVTDGKKPVINEGTTSIYPPVFDPPTGVYKMSKVVTMSSRTPGANIYFTADGSEPSASNGQLFASPVIVSADTTIKAVAVKDGAASLTNQAVYVVKTPVVKAEAPLFSFSGGNYYRAQSVEMKTATEGAVIKYTTDGTIPSATNGYVYSTPVNVDRQMVLKAVAIREGMQDSIVTSAVYDVNVITQTAPAPVFNPAPGAFISRQTVAIASAVNGATIKYTLDGTVPSFANGMVYTSPIVIMEPVTLKAVVISDGMQDSDVLSGFYDVNIVGPVLESAAEPVFSPEGGKYNNYNRFQVKIISQVKGAKIIYTTDGTTPSASNGEVYSEPITLTRSTTLKAFAVKDKMLDSAVVTAFYEIKNDDAPPAPPVIIGVKDGAITPETVSLSWNEQEGVTSSARLLKNNQFSQYSKNAILSEEGAYTLEVGVVKTSNNASNKASISFAIDKSLPVVPAIMGIGTGEVSARPVTLFWQDGFRTKSTARLVRKNGLKSDYVSGYEITEDGEYTLELLSVNERNGLTALSSISFAVNSALPDVPYITGVYDGDVVSEDVSADWKDADGITLAAKLSKNGGDALDYIKKTAISESGSYKLTLYAKNNAGGASNSRSIEFTIDKSEPDAPVIAGIADGAITSSEVRITWDDLLSQAGAAKLSKTGDLKKVSFTAEISKDSGRFEPYVKNTIISASGSYVVSLTAAKPNGRKKSSKLSFVIDRNAPDAPVISINDDGKGRTIINWEEQDNIEYFAVLSRDGGVTSAYTRETPVSEKGIYAVAVTARRMDTKSETVTKVSFNRTSTGLVVGPKAPELTGVENGAVTGSDVSIVWKEIEGAIVSARIKTNGGEFLEYKKGSMIKEEGSFIVEAEAADPASGLTAKSVVSFIIDKKGPYAPVIAGLSDGAVTAAEAKISWNEQNGCETTAKLTKTGQLNTSNSGNQYFPGYPGMYPGMGMYPGDYHDPLYYHYYFYRFYNLRSNADSNETQRRETAYEKNSPVAEDGEYELEVTARKLLNGLSASSKIKFTLDTKSPDAPYIMGIENGAVTADDVKLYWQKSDGVKYSAKLVKDGTMTLAYENASTVTVEGDYYLEVVATRESNGKTASASKKFKIDRSAPPVPAIKGVSEGDSTAKDVEISWDDVEAMSIAAKTSKDGAAALEYKKGSKLLTEGVYAFELTVTNPVTKVSNKKKIYFTIDRKKPDAPVISGISDGAVYSYDVSAAWNTQPGVIYKAYIVKESGATNDYISASPVGVDGDYRILVTALKANGLTSEASVKFTIDKKSPASPTIELKNGTAGAPGAQAPSYGGVIKQPVSGPTMVGWNEQEGCVTSAKISRNGAQAVSYEKGSHITEEGKYFVEVTAIKTKNGMQSKSSMRFSRMPDGFDAGPSAPKLAGVVAGSVNSKEVAVSWQEEPGVSYYAKLTKNSGNPIEFVNGSKISDDGSYDLEVTARKVSNGLTNRAAVSFKIDKALPAAPVIEGVSPEGVSASNLSLSWKESAGVYYSASINKNDEVLTSYGNGFPITENGRYVLEVTATKLSNGLKSTSTLNFTIDKNPPEEPVISGVETGSVTPKPVSIEWKSQEGVKTSAAIYRDGRSLRSAVNGMTLLDDGSYKIEVTAYKVSNGLSSKSSKSFIINKSMPEAPRVFGVENLKVYNSPVKPLWEEQAGTSVRAKISKDGAAAVDFIKGSSVAENGKFKLSVTAYGTNGLSNETALSFTIDQTAPEAPAISIISKDGATSATWTENKGFSYSAKISKTGGIPEVYSNGGPITEDGSYTLELTAVKDSNGLSVKSTVNFTRTGLKIEKGPAAPQVSGVENGRYYNMAVTPFWKAIDGAKISALLTKIGSQPAAIDNSTRIAEDGNYILEVTATNSVNDISSKTLAAFIIDTTRPSAVLKYSANPAAEGVMRITASYSEALSKLSVPRISINQPGSADINGAAMIQDPSNPASWYYDYTVRAADGLAYMDGVATVKLSDVSDPAGNISQAPQNASFVINTSAPAAAINYSFVPAVSRNMAQGAPDRSPAASNANIFRAGKLTVIVSFANDIKTGQTPKIFIDQPGYADVKDQPMVMGSSRRVWTYEYSIKPEDGQAYIDGQASVSISSAMDESGRVFLQPANRTFTIDTREPSVELSYSSNPAPAGKLKITAKYSEILQEGCVPIFRYSSRAPTSYLTPQ
ncbi:MAG TPA: chitobiase/beta-hexosaminidase C-terminal domain-containing protein [Candidatus Wallbacteria bacterium]|nr:chitobiase/beta-hexosaminidase C-terminal domain-containing protein [Candidatus Wallbacteria bacterium]